MTRVLGPFSEFTLLSQLSFRLRMRKLALGALQIRTTHIHRSPCRSALSSSASQRGILLLAAMKEPGTTSPCLVVQTLQDMA